MNAGAKKISGRPAGTRDGRSARARAGAPPPGSTRAPSADRRGRSSPRAWTFRAPPRGSASGRSLPSDGRPRAAVPQEDRKSTRLNSSHTVISYAVFCLKKKKKQNNINSTQKKKHKKKT